MLLMEECVAGGGEADEAPADERQLVDWYSLAELCVGERGERGVRIRRVGQVLQIEVDREGSWTSAVQTPLWRRKVVR